MTTDAVEQLSVALDATGRIVAAIRDDQWTAPTPCEAWTVRDVVGHLTAGNGVFASILRREPPDAPHGGVRPDSELPGLYRESISILLGAFRGPGVLDEVFTLPIGPAPGIVAAHLRITEALIHGWDVARATGQPSNFPADLAEQELTFARAKLPDLPPDRRPFAAPKPVADDAPAIDRLAALLGRDVTVEGPPSASPR